MTFSARLKEAAEWAILLGVKCAIVLLLIAAALALSVGDYALTRARAQNGQAAFEFIQHQVDAQKAIAPKGN